MKSVRQELLVFLPKKNTIDINLFSNIHFDMMKYTSKNRYRRWIIVLYGRLINEFR